MTTPTPKPRLHGLDMQAANADSKQRGYKKTSGTDDVGRAVGKRMVVFQVRGLRQVEIDTGTRTFTRWEKWG